MNYTQNLGQKGEDLAFQYLINKGYKIIERNFRLKWGELDIIAKAPDKTLVFIEVKTMREGGIDDLKPEDQMTAVKISKFKKAASFYANSRLELIHRKKGWRLDLLTLTINQKNCNIKHYENIF